MATRHHDNTQAASHSTPIALRREPTPAASGIQVSSPRLHTDAPIPARYTDYGEGRSPALRWSEVGGARSYALLVEDPDAPSAQPFVHWLAWNIPADTRELPDDVRADAASQRPAGMREGRNDHGGIGWFGPRPPAGDPAHRYHFQVFALDAMLDLPDGATRDELLRNIDGRVIAKGELVATSEAPTRQ
jgi:Raf kinase inhibitor-like YbhB/YbcL family protein